MRGWKQRIVFTGATAVAALSLTACVAPGASQRGVARSISLADFRSEASTDATGGVGPAIGDPATTGPNVPPATSTEAPAAATNSPPRPPILRAPPKVGETVVIDSLIGQVNGRPIYAEDFFRSIDAQLRAEAERLDARQWQLVASDIVRSRLQVVVIDQLFLSEALAALSEQERVGLLSWFEGFEKETIRQQGGGGLTAANLELLERENITVEDLVRDQEQLFLVWQLMQEHIEPRVIVSWRDVENEYQKRKAQGEFDRLASVEISRIFVPTTDATRVAEVQRRLGAGEPFTDIAASLGFEDGGAFDAYPFGEGGIASIPEDKLNPALTKQLEGLEVGDTTQPFQLGRNTWWLHVTGIKPERHESIYDVQTDLTAELTARRREVEKGRYIDSLFRQGSVDELGKMHQRLMEIAVARYGR